MTLALPLVSATVTPPLGAASVKATEHEEVPGASTEVGVQFRALNCANEVTLIEAVLLVLPAVAVTTAVVEADTNPAVAWKVALVAPAGIVTEAGTGRAVESLELNDAMKPPFGTAFVVATVQVVVPPAEIVEGEQATDDNTGGATKLSVAVRDTPA